MILLGLFVYLTIWLNQLVSMEDKKNTEQKILQTAMDIFVSKGKHGTKMQEIADAAGINKAMLHYYFRSKDKLFARVFENVFSGIFSTLHTTFENDDSFQQKLTNFVNAYCELIKTNSNLPLFILREIQEDSEEIKELFANILENYKFNLPFKFIDSTKKAIQEGEIKAVDPRQLLITVLGSSVFYFIAEPLLSVFLKNDPNYSREIFIDERKKAIVDIIFNGIKK